jgi:hypothetical protein
MQMGHITVLIPQNLHFDVLGVRNIFFQKDSRVPERAISFALGFIQQMGQIGRTMHYPHASAAAAKRRFDDQRESNVLGNLERLCSVLYRFLGASQSWDIVFPSQFARRHFVPHQFQNFGTWPDERNPRRRARAGELGILGEEAVPGMNEINLPLFGQRYQAWDVKVSADRSLAFADQVGFIRLESMDAEAIFLGVNRHSPQSQLRRRPENADGDFIAIGSQQPFGWPDGSRWRGLVTLGQDAHI